MYQDNWGTVSFLSKLQMLHTEKKGSLYKLLKEFQSVFKSF